MRKAIGKQLYYINAALDEIESFSIEEVVAVLRQRQLLRLMTICEVYTQQKHMYDTNTHTCENRIINFRQPFVRVIVRGKAGKRYEFGQKLEFVIVKGFTFIERQEWSPYNESTGLKDAIERYRQRFGKYPKAVLADKIYRTKDNRKFCKSKGIRLSEPRLGRPKADE